MSVKNWVISLACTKLLTCEQTASGILDLVGLKKLKLKLLQI